MAIERTLKKKICREGKERRGMYYIKNGKQARTFFKYLRKAAMSGRLPKNIYSDTSEAGREDFFAQ